jgi:hypothetical protein
VKASPFLLLALAAAACLGPHIETGVSPATPADTFSCMSSAVTDLGFTITSSQPATGFLRAQRRDSGSPESEEYTDLAISVYTNRDGDTEYQIQAGRTVGPPASTGRSNTIMPIDADVKVADAVVKRCGKH